MFFVPDHKRKPKGYFYWTNHSTVVAKYWHGQMHVSVLFVVAKLDFAEHLKKPVNLLLL